METLAVNEIFSSIQGEGYNTGKPALFVRFQGCPLSCPFCDTLYAKEKTQKQCGLLNDNRIVAKKKPSSLFANFQEKHLLQVINKTTKKGRLIVLTGGEPCDQDIHHLTTELVKNYEVQIETSGSRPIKCHDKVWVTISPKGQIGEENWERANEIKLVVGKREDIAKYEEKLTENKGKVICLQPVSCDKNATALCVNICIEKGWRLSLQSHKYIKIR